MKVKSGTVLLGLLEDGQLAKDFQEEIQTAITKTRDAVGGRASGSCSITLKLSLKIDGDGVEIASEISSNVPKPRRERTFLFVDKDGAVQTEHPRQINMFPEEVRAAARDV